jgi:hypothetical protein
MPAKLLELGRITQELNKFANLILRLITAGHVSESHCVCCVVEHLGFGLGNGKLTAATATLHLTHEENPNANQQQNR